MVSLTYRLPYFLFIAGTRSACSIILILTPGVLARSVTAAVGRPPTQKKASILRPFTAARAGRHALALQVGHLGDARALDRDHMHPVRVHHHERAHRHRLAVELVL